MVGGGGGVVDRTETVLQYLATRSESRLALIKFNIVFFFQNAAKRGN